MVGECSIMRNCIYSKTNGLRIYLFSELNEKRNLIGFKHIYFLKIIRYFEPFFCDNMAELSLE